MTKAASFVLKAAIFLMALLCFTGLWRVVALIDVHIPLDPNEGWNAYNAAAAMAEGPLYPPSTSFMVNNYPPLSFYLIGAVGRVLGNNIIAGRIVSLLSLGVVSTGLFMIARLMGCRQFEASFASSLFVAGMLVFTDYVGMNDPQMLAHAIAVMGFLLVLRDPAQTKQLAAAALLFVLAAFTKHNVIVMAVSITVWLALTDWRNAVRLAAFGLLFAVLGLVLFHFCYDKSLLSLLQSARTYTWDNLREGLGNWLHWSTVSLVGLAILIGIRGREKYVRLCAIYAAFGALIGVFFLAGTGVDANVLFDADIALALGAALLLNRLESQPKAALAAIAYVVPLFVAIGMSTDESVHDVNSWLHPMKAEAIAAQEDINFLEGRKGTALCEMLSLCYWAHKPATVDVFNVGQQFETGARSDQVLAKQIEARHFAVIQFDPDSPYSLGENVHDAMTRSYRLDHQDEFGSFYVPR